MSCQCFVDQFFGFLFHHLLYFFFIFCFLFFLFYITFLTISNCLYACEQCVSFSIFFFLSFLLIVIFFAPFFFFHSLHRVSFARSSSLFLVGWFRCCVILDLSTFCACESKTMYSSWRENFTQLSKQCYIVNCTDAFLDFWFKHTDSIGDVHCKQFFVNISISWRFSCYVCYDYDPINMAGSWWMAGARSHGKNKNVMKICVTIREFSGFFLRKICKQQCSATVSSLNRTI